ncbi:MAG: CocE/NonD family hydrolase [Acidobacteriaceae bacterium]|nr:CocE/NonD family hydrolase [Acidobacteriaceae bacterium]
MMRKAILSFICLACVSVLLRAAEPYAVTVERGVEVKMRDGVVLRADIYRPKAEGTFSVLLQRTPYDKRGGTAFGYQGAAQGYVVIIQDVRGRYTSEGEWYPFKHESEDGYNTVEWAAALPYSNGKVGMFGGSYVGATQMLAAIAHPPHLAGICAEVTASNYHANWTYQGGAFAQWFNESWTSGLAQDTLNRLVQKDTNALEGVRTLPLVKYPLFNFPAMPANPDLIEALAPYFRDWLAHPDYDAYWKQWSIAEHYNDIQVPTLTIAAWYDLFQGGSLRNYVGIKEHGGSEAARRGQHLLITIGGHAGSGQKIGEVDFGPTAAEFSADAITLRWYDYLFKGEQNEFAKVTPVRIFVMGSNVWRDEQDWPLARAQSTRYYLHAAHRANSAAGDGSLSTTEPQAEPEDRYIYDPDKPVPTVGGPLCCDGTHLPPGPRDQASVEKRDDVLVYSTTPFEQDTEVTGPVSLELYAKSSAVDTDFTAKLVDVWPNGFAQNLTEGIVRARYRDSQEKPVLMTGGTVYKFTIDLWSTSNVFKKGHRLRLEVSSSNFPRFDRNLNTGEGIEFARRHVVATNTVYHDAQHPSALILPIVTQ